MNFLTTIILSFCLMGTLSANENNVGAEEIRNSTSGPHLGNLSNEQSQLSGIHKLAFYAPFKTHNNSKILELFDGSKWYVNAKHQQRVQKWAQSKGNILFIKPTAKCFSSFTYVLYNQTTNEIAEVNFGGIPKDCQPFTQRIVKIDPYLRLIQLDDPDETVWEIAHDDYSFSQWKQGDYMIIGVNNQWKTTSYPHILINTRLGDNDFSEARFYGNGIY